MEEKEFESVPGTEETEEIDTVSGDIEEIQAKKRGVCVPCLLIWARYLLPAISLLLLLVMTFFYNVTIYTGGEEQELSIIRLYFNTFKGMHYYLGGETVAGRSWFYGIVTAGAIVGVVLFLLAFFLVGLAAFTATVAFLEGHESKQSDKMKVAFKVAFPNRVVLFLSDLLILLPLLYPHFFSLVSRSFLAIGGEEVIFILLNRPLIVGIILLVLTLTLALIIPKHERRQKMNMFLLHRSEKTSEEEECEDNE